MKELWITCYLSLSLMVRSCLGHGNPSLSLPSVSCVCLNVGGVNDSERVLDLQDNGSLLFSLLMISSYFLDSSG